MGKTFNSGERNKGMVGRRDSRSSLPVDVPRELRPVFEKAHDFVRQYFRDRVDDTDRGTISISGERYVLLRAASISKEFFDQIRSLYRDRGEAEARAVARSFLFDLAHAIGKADARSLHTAMGVSDPIAMLSAGPVHFAYSGWAFVKILPESNPTPDENFILVYEHPFSFEADAWLKEGRRTDFPVCIMSAGYSSGWCEDSFGMPLVAVEVECRAKGDSSCRFVMAPPGRIEHYLRDYEEGQGFQPEPRSSSSVPEFFRRKRLEEELQKSEETARALLNAIGDRALLLDREGRILALNEVAARAFGAGAEDLIGRCAFDLFPDDVARTRKAYHEEALRSAGSVRYQDVRDGRWLETVLCPITGDQGRVVRVAVISRDITEFKKTEEELKRSRLRLEEEVVERTRALRDTNDWLQNEIGRRLEAEERLELEKKRLESLVHHSSLAIVELDDQQRIIRCNRFFENLFQYASHEIQGRNLDSVVAESRFREDAEGYTRRTMGGEAIHGSGRRFRKDGTAIDVEFFGVPVIIEGKVMGAYGIYRDVSDRVRMEDAIRKSEQFLGAIFNTIQDGITVLDRDLNILRVNQAMRNWYRRALPLEGKKCYEAYHGRREPCHPCPTLRALRTGRLEMEEMSLRQERKDRATIELFAFPMFDEGRGIAGVVEYIRDVSGRKEAEEEKEKMQARLEDARKMEAIATLAGGIAHQFNNALASISLNLDLLQMNAREGKETSGTVKQMRGSTRRMAQLTSQLLAYAQGGKYQVRALSLSDLVRETLPSVGHTLEPTIHVDTDLPPDVRDVQADLMQMQMVLSAILSNASEAVEGDGHIRISTRNEYLDEEAAGAYPDIGPGRYVSLTIEDNGKGMDEGTRSRIFEPFFTTKFQGRGLGMPAVYGIVRNHGGCVLVESKIGKGTTVRVYLPAVDFEKVKPGIREAEPSRGAGTILVVEDEEMIMEVSRALLEKIGYRVLAAGSGKEAVRIATSHEGSIDLAVLDVILPDMAGREVYRRLQEARPGLKVVVCSGYSQDGPAREILDAGAQGFLQKPFSLEALMEKLRGVLKEGS